jgi:hypothetical protein
MGLDKLLIGLARVAPSLDQHGLAGLRTTRIQQYRMYWRLRSPSTSQRILLRRFSVRGH